MNKYTILSLLIFCSQLSYATDPVVSNVRVLGEGLYNGGLATQLTGNYVFTDDDGDTDASSYQWYRSSANDGTGLTAISGATNNRYTITASDIGNYIYFEVSPVDSNAETGVTASSSASSLVATTSYTDQTYSTTTTVNSGGTINYLNSTIANNKNLTVSNNTTLYIHGDLNTSKTTITVNAGSTLQISGQLIAANNLTIVNNGTLIVSSGLSAGNSAAISISGNVTIGGDLSLAAGGAGSLTVEGGGSLDVEGNLDITGSNITVTNPGTITVDGNADTGSSPIDGDGTISIGGECSGTNCSDGQILPIELGYFTVTSEENYNEIKWSTVSEINNDYFTLMRSIDAIEYEVIAKIEGAGNHQGLLEYSYKDYDAPKKSTYYKLKQTDYDGQFEEFDAVSVEKNALDISWTVFPNPVVDHLYIKGEQAIIQLMLSDLKGNIISNSADIHSSETELDLSFLNQGIYLLNIQTTGGVKSIKIVK